MDSVRFVDAQALLARLEPASGELTLIGGQAVNFWARQYLGRSAELRELEPFASKDIDFCGTVQQAELVARLLGGRCRVFGPDQLTRRHAVVEYFDEGGRSRSVDFLAAPFGVEGAELRQMTIPFEVPRSSAPPIIARVMHPIHVLESRAANVAELPGYRAENGLKQLRAAVLIAREFARDMLDAGRVRDVLRLNERVFRLAKGQTGLSVWAEDGVAVFEAVLRDPRLPEAFETVRYPQMREALAASQRAWTARAPAPPRAVENVPAAPGPVRGAEGAPREAGELVLVSKAFVGNGWMCELRDAQGAPRVVRGVEFGAEEPAAGDTVRLSGERLEVVSRGVERGLER